MSIAEQLDALSREMGMGLRRGMDRRGLTLAKVTNITDPEQFNRVKCLPIGSENTTDAEGKKTSEETDWCYVMTPSGGPERGIFWFPRVDDLVVLAYLDDDPHRPLVVGGLWTTEVKPPAVIADGKVLEYLLRTPSNIELHMHDEEDKHKTTLTMPSGAVLSMDDAGKMLELRDPEGKNGLCIDWQGGNLTLKAENKIELGVGDNVVTIEKSGNITIKGSAKILVEGANTEIKASNAAAMQGTQTTVKASATLELNGSTTAALKGGLVKIN